MTIPPPNSTENIRRVLEADELGVWAVHALEYLLAENVKLLDARDAMRTELEQLRLQAQAMQNLLPAWQAKAHHAAHDHEGDDYQLGAARGIRDCREALIDVIERTLFDGKTLEELQQEGERLRAEVCELMREGVQV